MTDSRAVKRPGVWKRMRNSVGRTVGRISSILTRGSPKPAVPQYTEADRARAIKELAEFHRDVVVAEMNQTNEYIPTQHHPHQALPPTSVRASSSGASIPAMKLMRNPCTNLFLNWISTVPPTRTLTLCALSLKFVIYNHILRFFIVILI